MNVRAWWLFAGLAMAGAAVGCMSEQASETALDGASAGSGDYTGAPGESASSGTTTGGADDGDYGSDPAGNGNGNGIEPGTLTAGVWDDNRNYDFFKSYLENTKQLSGLLNLSQAARDAAYTRSLQQPGSRKLLDVALVIDTTGSMGDEIAYLQVEFDAIASKIASLYPNAKQRWGLVLYRDHGDAYVTRSFDFREDTNAFRNDLGKQNAGGGGDYPEASPEALEAAMQLAWRDDADAARLMFWVTDAPHHPEGAPKLTSAINASVQAGVHIYPIASSGVDELAENTMRSAAQVTNGRYIFLTDDSGVGGAHKEPTIPCYFVTKLDSAILRMVDIEMSGFYREPDPDEIIRTGGDPQDGSCELDSGDVVVVF